MVSDTSSELDEELLEDWTDDELLGFWLELDDGSKELLLWTCELELTLLLLDEIVSLAEEDSLFDDVPFELFSLTGKEELDSTIIEEDDLAFEVQAISVLMLNKSNNLAFFIV